MLPQLLPLHSTALTCDLDPIFTLASTDFECSRRCTLLFRQSMGVRKLFLKHAKDAFLTRMPRVRCNAGSTIDRLGLRFPTSEHRCRYCGRSDFEEPVTCVACRCSCSCYVRRSCMQLETSNYSTIVATQQPLVLWSRDAFASVHAMSTTREYAFIHYLTGSSRDAAVYYYSPRRLVVDPTAYISGCLAARRVANRVRCIESRPLGSS